jgi:hypothetical protein
MVDHTCHAHLTSLHPLNGHDSFDFLRNIFTTFLFGHYHPHQSQAATIIIQQQQKQ